MPQSPLIDAYIAAAPEFAQPILDRLRLLAHKACPDLEETIKWGVPHFERQGIVAGMAAFKNHVSFGYWRAKELPDPQGLFTDKAESMCALKFATLKDLPAERVLVTYTKHAVRLNESGTKKKAPARSRRTKDDLDIPPYFAAALRKNRKAKSTFDAFPYSHQKEYLEWITEAKREDTRTRRLAQMVEWLEEGKSRNWKYEPAKKASAPPARTARARRPD